MLAYHVPGPQIATSCGAGLRQSQAGHIYSATLMSENLVLRFKGPLATKTNPFISPFHIWRDFRDDKNPLKDTYTIIDLE